MNKINILNTLILSSYIFNIMSIELMYLLLEKLMLEYYHCKMSYHLICHFFTTRRTFPYGIDMYLLYINEVKMLQCTVDLWLQRRALLQLQFCIINDMWSL